MEGCCIQWVCLCRRLAPMHWSGLTLMLGQFDLQLCCHLHLIESCCTIWRHCPIQIIIVPVVVVCLIMLLQKKTNAQSMKLAISCLVVTHFTVFSFHVAPSTSLQLLPVFNMVSSSVAFLLQSLSSMLSFSLLFCFTALHATVSLLSSDSFLWAEVEENVEFWCNEAMEAITLRTVSGNQSHWQCQPT